MNLVENFSMIEGKQRDIRELAMAKTEISDHFNTPKISSSVSFNSLAKVKGRTRTKSPLVHDRSHDYSNVINPPTNQLTGKFKQGINVGNYGYNSMNNHIVGTKDFQEAATSLWNDFSEDSIEIDKV